MNKRTKILISVFFLTFVSGSFMSQDKPVIISSKVGEQIDSVERIKYGILGGKFFDFKSAVFYRTNDGKYFVKINCAKDTIISIDENTLFSTALRVEYFDDISKGIPPLNPKFLLDSTENNYAVRINNVYPDKLPFASSNRKSKPSDPIVGLGVSFSYMLVDLGPVQNFFNKVENSFKESGWEVGSNNLDFNVSAMYAFNLYIRLFSTLGLDFETGKSTNSDVDLWYSAGYLCYNFDLKKPGWIKPFVSAGIGKYSYYVEKFYNAEVNTNGAYLEKISSGGGRAGYFFKTGFDLGIPTGGRYLPFCLNVFALYSYFPEIRSEDYGYITAVKLGGVRLGAGLRIYL
jgi:hypothetical protein